MLRLSSFIADVKAAILSSAPIGTTVAAAASFTNLTVSGVHIEFVSNSIPSDGGIVSIPSGVMMKIINPAATLATLTVTTPAAPVNVGGTVQRLTVVFTKAVTAVTWTAGAGTTNTGAALPASAAIGGVVNFVWVQSLSQWVHVLNA